MHSEAEPRELACLREGSRLLEQACSFEDILKVRDQSQIARHFLQKLGYSTAVINRACELNVRTERQLGRWLINRPPAKPGPKPPEELCDTKSHNYGSSLEELGIDRKCSSRWQAIAGIDDGIFEQELSAIKAAGKEITTAAFLRLAAKQEPPQQQKPWSLHEHLELLNDKIYSVYERWPPEKYGILAARLISIGNELREKGELCE